MYITLCFKILMTAQTAPANMVHVKTEMMIIHVNVQQDGKDTIVTKVSFISKEHNCHKGEADGRK